MAALVLQDAAFVCAFMWILYRSWQIYKKPREELEELLGLDIPPVPEVSLAEITSDTVMLYWKPPDPQSASLKLAIQVNGIRVGEFSRGDSSIEITGLRPGNYYSIRVLATNTANFTTQGSLIRLRTTPLSQSTEASTSSYTSQTEFATVRTTSTPFDTALASPTIREANTIHNPAKKTTPGRRNSPVAPNTEATAGQAVQTPGSDEDESQESIHRLTERLEHLRSENQRIDRETSQEEQETKRYLSSLTKERDRLRQEHKDREEASAELRKHGNYLDKLNRTAQSKKAAKEKQLQQKKTDRQKITDNIARWDKEALEMKRDTEEMVKEKADMILAKDEEVTHIRNGIIEDLAIIKLLEEDIRVKGIQIKAMEREQEKMSNDGSGMQDSERAKQDNEQAWELRVHAVQAQLGSLWQTVQQAELEKQQSEEHLAWWMSRRARNPEQFALIASVDFTTLIHRNRSRRNRQTASRTSTLSSPSMSYQSGSMNFTSSSAISPQFTAASPFFNMSNGMTVPPIAERPGMSQTDPEVLSSGGPMSPAANSLLPSNLFRDEDNAIQRFADTTAQENVSSVNGELFLGRVNSKPDGPGHGPHMSGSPNSRSESLFSSPQDSLHNLHSYSSRPDPFDEVGQQSGPVTSSPFVSTVSADAGPLATSRLASLFSSTFIRPRGKPDTQDPPHLGTLKQGQSQSFPRNLEQDSIVVSASRRRRGSHGTWANPMAGLLTRNTGTPGDSEIIKARTGSGRRSRLNMFASKIDVRDSATLADQTLSSRPSSTYSYDQIYGRLSSDSQRFGWPVTETQPNRSSPLGANWSGGPWSRAQSRRPSVQHGSTSNLSIGSTPLDSDSFLGPILKPSSEQAPIGTRPQSSQRPITPKLNPAAPSFKTLFSRGDTRKAAKGEKSNFKSKEKAKERDSEKGELEDGESVTESSPHDPRLSRDAQSIVTAASTAGSHDSFDRSTSGTPSEVLAPSTQKETLMQKITRKSSSGKFNVPWAKERVLFSKRAGEPSPPGESEETPPSEVQYSRNSESAGSTPQQEKSGRSSVLWPNIRRKSKKGDQTMTEAVEKAVQIEDSDGT